MEETLESGTSKGVNMNMFDEGNTLLFESKEYLIMKRVDLEGSSYLVLASNSEDFQLIVCRIVSNTNIERVLDQELVPKILFQMGVL